MRTPQDRHVLLCLAIVALVSAFAAVGGHRASAEPVVAQGDDVGPGELRIGGEHDRHLGAAVVREHLSV